MTIRILYREEIYSYNALHMEMEEEQNNDHRL